MNYSQTYGQRKREQERQDDKENLKMGIVWAVLIALFFLGISY